MTKGPVQAYLSEEGRKIFTAAFPDGVVPLQGFAGGVADLAGLGNQEVQFVDVKALSAEELENLLSILSNRFKAPPDEIRKEILSRGLPLRRSLIDMVVFRDPARWVC